MDAERMSETAPAPVLKTRTYRFRFISRDTANAVSDDGVTPMIHDTPVDAFIDQKMNDEGAEFLCLRTLYAGQEELKLREIVPPADVAPE